MGSSFLCASLVAMATACGGPSKAESPSGQRLPADGATSAPAPTMPTKTIAADEWSRLNAESVKPSCIAREGVRTADAPSLEGAGKVIGTWTTLNSQKGKSRTGDGREVGSNRAEPTRKVESVGMTCAAGASMILVNGVVYPFDVAWVVSGQGRGPTLDGTNKGAGYFAMMEAISFKDQRVIFTKVFVPSNSNDDTDDTVIISSLAGFLPTSSTEAIVRRIGDREEPQLETFILAKGENKNTGISFVAPQEGALGRARYLAVAKFQVAP